MQLKRNKDGTGTENFADAGAPRRPKPSLSVALRQQTPKERHDFETALQIFLKEVVHRTLNGET